MKKMLVKDPKQRISAHEALNHQWIATGGVFMSPRTMAPIYLSSAQENMKKFQEQYMLLYPQSYIVLTNSFTKLVIGLTSRI